MTSFRQIAVSFLAFMMLAGCGNAASSTAASVSTELPVTPSAEPSAVSTVESETPAASSPAASQSDIPVVQTLTLIDPNLPYISFIPDNYNDFITVRTNADPSLYDGSDQDIVTKENNVLKELVQKAGEMLSNADLQKETDVTVDWRKMRYQIILNDNDRSTLSLYSDGTVSTYSDRSSLRYYKCVNIGEILKAFDDAVQQYMALNDQLNDGMKIHTETLIHGTSVRELNDAGITTLLNVLKNSELGFYGADAETITTTDLPSDADPNLDYTIVDGFSVKEGLRRYALTYLPADYLSDFDSRVIEYKGKVLVGRGAMGWGNWLFEPLVWMKKDDETVYVQYTNGGDVVFDVYAMVHFRKDGDHWIIDTLTWPDYSSENGNGSWKNPE